MKKAILYLMSIVLFLLIILTGVLAYLYSSHGNKYVQNYLEKKIQEETHLPVRFHTFQLSRGHLYFIATLGQEASLGFDGRFDLLHRRLNGRYLLKATQAHYQKYTLRQANIAGHVNGTLNDLTLKGKGTLLDGPVAFALKIRQQKAQDIVVQLRRLPLDELLALGGQAPIVHGQLNADVMLPSIGKQGSKGRVIAQLADAAFDPVTIQKLYHYTLPSDKTALSGIVHAQLDGEQVVFDSQIVSQLITVHLQNGQANLTDKNAACNLSIDTAELAPVTQNKLHGPLKLSGSFKYDTFGVQVHAQTASFGGNLMLDYSKSIRVKLSKIALARILKLTGQADYAEGTLNGTVSLKTAKAQNGQYRLRLGQGKIHHTVFNRQLGTSLLADTPFTLRSEGTFKNGILSAASELHSKLLDATLSQTQLTLKSGNVKSHYRLHIPNPLLLTGKSGKGVPVTLGGTFSKNKNIHVKGEAKGLGKRLAFDYAGTQLSVWGDGVIVERLLSSGGLPTYLSGVVDTRVDLTSLHPLKGTISLRAPHLTTHPDAMQKLIGKPLNTTLSLLVEGKASKGIFHGKAELKSPLASLTLSPLALDVQAKSFTSPFGLHVPDLSRLQPLTDTKLNGPLTTTGQIRSRKQLDIQGSSNSLDGKIIYHYHGTQLETKLQAVALPKLLHMLDQPEQLLGTLNGNLLYNTASRKGKAHLTIDRFQFKPGKLTSAVTLLLKKNLTQIIYDQAVADARFNGDLIGYRFKANGHPSDFVIQDGKLNSKTKTNQASFGLRIDDMDVIGTIKGPIKDPKISVLPGKMLRNRLKKKVMEKVAPKLKKATTNIIKKIPKLF